MKYFTLLKSPHVNKKARDQYEIRVYSSFIKFDYLIKSLNDLKKIEKLLFIIKQETTDVGSSINTYTQINYINKKIN